MKNLLHFSRGNKIILDCCYGNENLEVGGTDREGVPKKKRENELLKRLVGKEMRNYEYFINF